MIAPASYEAFKHAYIVEKTVDVEAEIRGESQMIRIEALRHFRDGHYSTRAYRQEHVTLQPTYPQSGGKNDRLPEDYRIWVDYDLPWTHHEDADSALSQALGFLSERCDK